MSRRFWVVGLVGALVVAAAVFWFMRVFDSTDDEPASASCPVADDICAFAFERETLLQSRDFVSFLTPSPYQRSGDIESFTNWLDGTLPVFDGWKPELVSIGCPVTGDPATASCAHAFSLAFSTLGQPASGGVVGLGEFLYRRQSQDGSGRPELRSVARPDESDVAVILGGGATVSTRDFQVPDRLPGAVPVVWFSLDPGFYYLVPW